PRRAVALFRKAAQQGHVNAQYNLALLLAQGIGGEKDPVQAIRWLKKSAQQGFADAQNNLGVFYLEGRGVPQNYEQALEWFHKARERGNVDALFNIGVMYDRGLGVKADFAESVRWYWKAAEADSPGAQFVISGMYASGLGRRYGFPYDLKKAAIWRERSAKGGWVPAQLAMGHRALKKSATTPALKKEAEHWFSLAAQTGAPEGQYALAMLYLEENGKREYSPEMRHEQARAEKLLYHAAQSGLPEASYQMGLLLERRSALKKERITNKNNALFYFTQAAERGLAQAQERLGLLYADGRGVDRNYQKAEFWLKKAALQGKIRAQYSLALIHAEGLGTAQDFHKGYLWAHWAASRQKGGSSEERREAQRIESAIRSMMPPDMLSEARQRAKTWRP
ncbi:tetratricopeptide repeat protein, partial [Magnetococcales bacterium HHB-1]